MGQFGKPLWQSILHEHLKSDQPPGVWHRRVSSARKSIEYAFIAPGSPSSFSTSLNYQSTFPVGIQEGILVLYAHNNANGSIASAVKKKVRVRGLA